MEESVSRVESARIEERQAELPAWTEMPEHKRQELVAVLAEMLLKSREASDET